MNHTPSQQMMIDDGLPSAFILTKQERHALWEKSPPRSIAWVDPRIEAERAMREQQKKDQTQKRIQALLQSKGLISQNHIAIKSTQPQENNMPKFVIKPLDQHGAPVIRGYDFG